jgi:hypothetical protein
MNCKICESSKILKSIDFYIWILFLILKSRILDAGRWSSRPKYVAYVDETNKTLFWLTAAR